MPSSQPDDGTRFRCRVVWLVSAIASLLSARYILVESQFHYPLLLLLAQLFVTAVVAIIRHPRLAGSRDAEPEVSAWRSSSPNSRGSMMTVCAMCVSAISLMLLLQAVLRNDNLPTLVMLVTIALFVRDFLCLISGYGSCSPAEVLRIGLMLLTSIGILVAEYRLSDSGLKNSIATMLCLGLASALRKVAAQRYPKDKLGRKEESLWLLGLGLAFGAIGIIFFWPDKIYVLSELQNMSLWLLLPLAINISATTTTLLLGRSTMLPMDEDLETVPGIDNTDEYDVFILLFLTGFIGCFSTMPPRRSYSNWIQHCCFAIAMLCASCKALTLGRKKRNIWQDEISSYELLNGLAEAQMDGDEVNDPRDSEEVIDPPDLPNPLYVEIQSPFNKTTILKVNVIGALLLLMVWAMTFGVNYLGPEFPGKAASIDHLYVPSAPLEIVINMYKEPLEDVKRLVDGLKSAPEMSKASITIYTKDQEADTEKVKLVTSANNVIKLPNIGREGETYLHHINTHWDSLAKHTMYLPADTNFSREFYRRLRNFFDPNRTGFLSLTWSYPCDCAECGDQFFWHDTAGLFPKYYKEIYNSANCTNVLLSYKGTFIVSAARTRGVKKTMYEELWQAFVDENSWAHQQNFTLGRPDSMSAPDFGFTMERMWGLLFQCSHVDEAWKCPSLKSGWRVGGDIADCQCLDFDVSTSGQGATGVKSQ